MPARHRYRSCRVAARDCRHRCLERSHGRRLDPSREPASAAKPGDFGVGRIQWADASRKPPFLEASVEVIYSCHVLEHLDRQGVRRFLAEALRVLEPAGIFRLSVPDLRRLVDRNVENGDGDRFIAETLLVSPKPRWLRERVQSLAIGGPPSSLALYDATSLCRLLGVWLCRPDHVARPLQQKYGIRGHSTCGSATRRVLVEAVKPAC